MGCSCGCGQAIHVGADSFFSEDARIMILALAEAGEQRGTNYGKDFEVAGLDEQVQRVGEHFAELTDRNFANAIAMKILRASVEGQTPDQIVESVRRESEGMARKTADAWVQTVESWLYNSARLQEMREDPFVSKVRFVAILDEATTEICRRLDGKVYEKTDPNLDAIKPPLHFRCRSQLQPISDFSKVKYPLPSDAKAAIKEISKSGNPAFVQKTNLLDESLFDRAPRSEWTPAKKQQYEGMIGTVLSISKAAGLTEAREKELRRNFDEIADLPTDSEKIDALGKAVQKLRKGIAPEFVDEIADTLIGTGFLNLRNWGEINQRGLEIMERNSDSEIARRSSEEKARIKRDVAISEGRANVAPVNRNRWGIAPRLVEWRDPVVPQVGAPKSEQPGFRASMLPIELQKAIASYTTGRYKYLRNYWQTGETKSDGVRAAGDLIKKALEGYRGDADGTIYRGIHLGNSEGPDPGAWTRLINSKPGDVVQVDDQPTSWDKRETVANWFSKKWDENQRSVVFELEQAEPGLNIRPLSYYRDWQTEVLKPGVKMQIEKIDFDPRTNTLKIKGKEV